MEINRTWRKWKPDKSAPPQKPNIPDDNGQPVDSSGEGKVDVKPSETKGTLKRKANARYKPIDNKPVDMGNLDLKPIIKPIALSRAEASGMSNEVYLERRGKISFQYKFEVNNRKIQEYKRNADSSYEESRLESLEIRRLTNAVANVFAKVAEDLTGEPVPGDDEWSVPDLLTRKVTRKPITKCRIDRERERLVFILDNSPSCSAETSFYSTLSTAASKLQYVDIYTAPNGRITSKMNPKTGLFEEIPWRDCCETIMNTAPEHSIEAHLGNWAKWKNRVIMFFGDFDGCDILSGASRHAKKVYWFCNLDQTEIDWYLEEHCVYTYGYDERGHDYPLGEIYVGEIYSCAEKEDFIRLVKKMRA